MAFPANLTTVTVVGSFITPEGTASTGTVTFTASSWLTNSGANLSIPNSAVTKTLGTAGDFSATIPITDDADISPTGWVYTVAEVVDGVSRSYDVTIPGTVVAGGTVYLADLTPAAAAGPEYYSLASSLSIGTVSTLAAGSAATATITGLAPNQTLNLGIPTGPTGAAGSAATIAVGSTSSVSNSGTAAVTNVGSSSAGTFNFVLRDGPTGPTGATGATGPQGPSATIAVGSTSSVPNSGTATVTNVGSSTAGTFDFVLRDGPTGPTGPQGNTGTLAVGSVTSVPNSGTATITNVGSSTAGTFDFVLRDGPTGPQGATGATGAQGPAATVAVGTIGSVAYPGPGTVTNSGTSGAAVLDFVLVTGPQGATGATGSTGPQGAAGSAATVTVGTVGAVAYPGPGTVTNSGSSSAAVLDFTLVTGQTGATGPQGPQGSAATITVGSVTAVAYGGTASVTNTGTSGSAVLDFVLVTGPQGAIGDLTATAPIDYTSSTFSLRYGAGLGTATGGTLVADFSDATPQPLAAAGSAGSSTELARGDHAHARPTAADIGAVGTATTITAGTALAGGGDLTTSRTLNVTLSDATPLAVGTPAAGTAVTPSRADHVHEGTTLSSATPANLGVAAAGTATTASRGDHVHSMPSAADVGAVGTATAITAGTGLAGGGALTTSRTLNVVFSDANAQALGVAAAGTAQTSSRSDHVHAAPTPAGIGAIGTAELSSATPLAVDSATGSAGTATTVARSDHDHANGIYSLITAAGQVIASSGSATPAIVPVGTVNGHVLTWATAESTKMKWAAASGGGAAIDPLFLAGV